jgi:CheY-like chemotaxis protein
MWTPYEHGEHSSPDEHTDDGGEGNPAWLLLVEDDSVTARALGRLIGRASGMLVRVADSGDAAVVLARTFGEPTAIVTDFQLGGGEDGVQVLSRLRAAGCHAPPAILTGAPEQALLSLESSDLDEVVPVFMKQDVGSRLCEWLDQLRLFWARSA